jgi:hypothetical protein
MSSALSLKRMFVLRKFLYLFLLAVACPRMRAQDTPYFVTYDHHMEEAGTLEIETFSTMGFPQGPEPADLAERGQRFYAAPYAEIEYAVQNRWTTAFYLEGQSTSGDSTLFTGWRWENRYRLFKKDHWLNPVLYIEDERLNEASRIAKEVVGEGPDLDVSNASLRGVKAHELETKLILSSDAHHWNVSENFIVEKNLSRGEGFEFGYAVGISRSLSNSTQIPVCRFCRQRFVVGLEAYGATGNTISGYSFSDTAQYVAPAVLYQLGARGLLRFSAAFGIGHESSRALLRVGYSYEIPSFLRRLRELK